MALEILDEMVAVLDECGAVLLMLSDEAALNLDELGEVVDVARGEAINAFGAASLLNRHADLSESWTDDLSRPRAIYARHSKAVRSGAARVKPAVPTARFPMAEEAIEHVLAVAGHGRQRQHDQGRGGREEDEAHHLPAGGRPHGD